ncbi:MAG TPA: radical SAM protein [Phycisphaerae bacterium]|nr:radical SAM protein [Phycisphaerae bacterium]HDZ45133.1 radical SAM protein [Phycisphaerae bacterium]
MRAIRHMRNIQIDVTNLCDGPKCSNCTRMLAHHRRRFIMSFENFKIAVRSLAEFPGVVGVFGGNPCMIGQFEAYSRWFARARAGKRRRGIWTNNYGPHATLCREIYGTHNYNPHRSECYHCPTMVAIKDVVADARTMWELIDRCPINLTWSACITEINGQPRAYFCEIAAAWDHVYREDNGLPVVDGWWEWDLSRFDRQIRRWCPNCGMACPLPARRDIDRVDDVSDTHLPVVAAGRSVERFDPAGYDLAEQRRRWRHPLDYLLLRSDKRRRNLRKSP